MLYEKKTWNSRTGSGLNKFILKSIDTQKEERIELVNDPDIVYEQGTALSSTNLNDLEERIENGFKDSSSDLETEIDKVNESITTHNHDSSYFKKTTNWQTSEDSSGNLVFTYNGK